MYRRMYRSEANRKRESDGGSSDSTSRMSDVVFDETEEAKMKEIALSSGYDNLTFDEIKRFFQWAAQWLRKKGSDDYMECWPVLQTIDMINDDNPERCQEFSEWLTSYGVHSTLMRFAKDMYAKKKLEGLDDDIGETVLNIMITLTDASETFIKALAGEGAVEFFTDILSQVRAWEEEDTEGLEDKTLSILHNMARVAELKSSFKEAQAAKAILPSVKSRSSEFRALAVLTLAHIADEEDNDSLIDDTNTIGDCVAWLKSALEEDDGDRRYRGFSAWELTLGLAKLAVNDTNKKKIVEEGALEALLKLLEFTDSKEQAASAECLWTLAFDKNAREQILTYPDLVPALENLKDSSDKEVKKNVRGALWMIKGNNTSHVTTAGSANENHIFISYSWNEKELVKKIHKNLKQAGFKVWVDWEQMGGSTLQAMAEAVEKSAVVLVCMSEKYKQSPNCRTEAEYTFQQRKEYIPLLMQRKYKPDGWLGALLGAKLFFDFSGKYPFENKWKELLRELQGKISSSVSGLAQDVPDSRPVATPAKASCLTMSQEDVQKLLESKGLVKIPPAMTEYDGQLLWQLKKLREMDPRYFHKTMESQFDMNLTDILRLSAAMDEIQ